MLVGHHRHIVETIHVRKCLQIGLGLDQLFGRPMQQADVRIGTLDGLAIKLQHKA